LAIPKSILDHKITVRYFRKELHYLEEEEDIGLQRTSIFTHSREINVYLSLTFNNSPNVSTTCIHCEH